MIVTHNNHTIEIKNNGFIGKETIIYDGKVVSEKSSIGGSTPIFKANEENEDLQYKVENNMKWHGIYNSGKEERVDYLHE